MKIGIITMHKVLNYGSALQAYALQHKLEEMGYDSEIIDYVFLPKKEKKNIFRGVTNQIIIFLRAMVMGFPQTKKKRKFNDFYKRYYHLSNKQYNANTIKENPPVYDVYMTGSDQVWNPKHIDMDANFLLAFAPDGAKKISYASSFATSHIQNSHKLLYKKWLTEYNSISVREQSGVGIVKELLGKDATVCCDPVFLLKKEQWDALANASHVNVKERYILVYALYYMFDPYPELLQIIDHVQMQLGCKVIYLDGRKDDIFRKNSRVIKSDGPADFIQLVKGAEMVITSSFHGTAFSLIYEKPLMAIVRGSDTEDSRITSLLSQVHAENSITIYNKGCNMRRDELYKLKNKRGDIEKYIKKSEDYLTTVLDKE